MQTSNKTEYEREWMEVLLDDVHAKECLKELDKIDLTTVSEYARTPEWTNTQLVKYRTAWRMLHAIARVTDNDVLWDIFHDMFGYADNPDDEMDSIQGGSQW